MLAVHSDIASSCERAFGRSCDGLVAPGFHQSRPQRNQHDPDHDRDDEPEKAVDEQAGDQDRRDANRHRHDEPHPITSRVKQATERAYHETYQYQSDDV
jgi:hypothetical protein